ncbi:MAG: FAD-binding oxidoreductase [Chloroflexi bacterium]|nr:FAD-binding oxidoreductase [Chloroflexota bacterium]
MQSVPVTSAARALAEELRRIVGPDRVLTAPEEMHARYRRLAWIPATPRVPEPLPLGPPAAVVRPRAAGEVAEILRQASRARVVVVPYGGGTGVMGGAIPTEGCLLLDLGGLDRIRELRREDLLAHVEAGVILETLAREAEAHGLLFAHDPWSRPIATVGGAISTNGVGYLAAGYGAMGDQIRGLEIALATGEVITWNGAVKGPGPDLWRLFVGAEGTLGVVTAASLQLHPLPQARLLAAFRFPRFVDGFRAVSDLRVQGIRPVMVDLEETGGPPLDAPTDLYLAFDGPPAIARALLRQAVAICRARNGTSRGARAARHFWDHRHDSAYWFLRRIATGSRRDTSPALYANVAVPASRVIEYCTEVVRTAERFGLEAHSFGLWARPELVSFTLEAPSVAAGRGRLDEASDTVLGLARDLGGSIEYCHGVGLRLAHLLQAEPGGTQALLARIKHTLDPSAILNPGKLGLTG